MYSNVYVQASAVEVLRCTDEDTIPNMSHSE